MNHPSLKTNLKAHTAYVYFETQGTHLNFFFKSVIKEDFKWCKQFIYFCCPMYSFARDNIAWIQFSKNISTTDT